MAKIERVMVPGQLKPVSHYCHVVKSGNLIWVSGAVGAREDGSVPSDVGEQAKIALENIDACLKAVGAGPANVVKVTVYLTDINDRRAVNEPRKAYFGEHLPASTLVQIVSLVLPELKVEIEAQAILP